MFLKLTNETGRRMRLRASLVVCYYESSLPDDKFQRLTYIKLNNNEGYHVLETPETIDKMLEEMPVELKMRYLEQE